MTSQGDAGGAALLRRLAALNDMVRLRLLRLLEKQELSVGELARIVQLPQSTISRHLKLLFEGDWVARRNEGTASLYRMDQSLARPARDLWALARDEVGDPDEDDHRMVQVLAERAADSEAFFGRIGAEWDKLRRDLFGEAFTTSALLSLLDPGSVIADLGCGTGPVSEVMAPVVERVIALDRETTMLDAARTRLAAFDNVEFKQGDLTDVPIGDAAVDAAVVFLVMVYLDDPQRAVAEIARILRPGGVGLIVDLLPHGRDSYSHTLGHRHLGFEADQVQAWGRAAGLPRVMYRRLRPETTARGPGLFVATLRK